MNPSDAAARWFNEFEEFWQRGANYSALVRLGLIYMALQEVPAADRSQLAERLAALDIPAERLHRAEEDARLHIERIDRILSVGEHYNPDEVLLILTLREGLAAFATLLDRRFKPAPALSLDELDRLVMQKIGRMKIFGINARLFANFKRHYGPGMGDGE